MLRFSAQDHIRVFAVLAAAVSFVAMAVPPLAGALSDKMRRRHVPRRAFILVGAALDVGCLVMMAQVTSLALFTTFLLLATVGANIALAAYQALLPDVVPKASWGTVSGMRSLALIVGTVLGIGVAGGTYPQSTFIGIAAAVGLGALTLFAVNENIAPNEREDRARISDWHDFRVVFIARLFLAFGLALLMTFILYFFRDVLRVGNPQGGTALVAAASLVGGVISAIYLGWLSDRVKRKLVVAACGIPMMLAAAGFALLPEERWIYAFAVLFGVGFGGILSTGWALAIDSVPKLRDVGRDLGIWGIAQNFPAVIAPLFGGWLLSTYGATVDGYRLLFLSAAGSFAIGSAAVLAVGRRPALPWWGPAIRCLAALTVLCYMALAYRVRFFGRLPVRRGPALVLSNHQIDQDLMAFTARTFLTTHGRTLLLAATAKLLFEPGFMALRIPWLWFLFRRLNIGWLFKGIGMLPIENELQSRSVVRWAWSAQRMHGPLPLEDVFKPSVIERYGFAGLRTSDLFGATHFRKAESAYARLTELQPAIGREQLDATRRGVTEDLDRIEAAVRAGATFYVTPEGEYSKDGAMLPFRGIWNRLEPIAEEIYLAAISYDPFVGRRLSILYHVVPLRNRERVVDELRAARPVTISAILSQWLVTQPGPFSEEQAQNAVAEQLRLLPRSLFVDPDLARSPKKLTAAALARLLHYGILTRRDGTFRVAARRRHPAFPDVDDILAFQATFINETLASAPNSQARLTEVMAGKPANVGNFQ